MIETGKPLPSAIVRRTTADGAEEVDVATLFAGGTGILTGLPGAFTPTCNDGHIPGYVRNADAFRARGVSRIAVTAVNDFFVMSAWGRSTGASDAGLEMLADFDALLARALGLTLDLSTAGLGLRSMRYAMIITDGIVRHLEVEPDTKLSVADATTTLAAL